MNAAWPINFVTKRNDLRFVEPSLAASLKYLVQFIQSELHEWATAPLRCCLCTLFYTWCFARGVSAKVSAFSSRLLKIAIKSLFGFLGSLVLFYVSDSEEQFLLQMVHLI